MTHKSTVQMDAEEEVRDSQRRQALKSVYQTADRIITGRTVTVKVVSQSAKPVAYTIGDTITLNAARLDTRSNSSIAQMTGANHHEVGHLLFSPRAGDNLLERINAHAGSRVYYPTYNILEDARIERLLIARHPSMKPFLTLTVTELLVNVDDEDLASSYPLIAGRTYLPGAVRAASRQAYVYPDDVDELDRISQAYARLTFPGDEAEAFALIKAFHALLYNVAPPQQCDSGQTGQTTAPEDADQQRALQVIADDQDDDEDQGDQSGSQGGGEDDDDEDQGDDAPSAKTATVTRSATNGKKRKVRKATVGKIRAVVKQAAKDALDDKEVREAVDNTRKQLTRKDVVTPDENLLKVDLRDVPFSPAALALTRQIGGELRRLISAHEPGWRREQPTGRINLARVMEGRDLTEVFDRWEQGTDDGVDLEAVLLLDASGSMAGVMDVVSEAAGVLQRALVSGGVECSTYGFSPSNPGPFRIYARGDNPRRVKSVEAITWTYVAHALRRAYQTMLVSRARRRLVVILTDGDWDDRSNSEQLIAALQSEKVTVAIAFLDTGSVRNTSSLEQIRQRSGHNADVFRLIESGKDLVPFTREVVTSLLHRPGRG